MATSECGLQNSRRRNSLLGPAWRKRMALGALTFALVPGSLSAQHGWGWFRQDSSAKSAESTEKRRPKQGFAAAIDQLLTESREHAAAGRYDEAVRAATRAHKIAEAAKGTLGKDDSVSPQATQAWLDQLAMTARPTVTPSLAQTAPARRPAPPANAPRSPIPAQAPLVVTRPAPVARPIASVAPTAPRMTTAATAPETTTEPAVALAAVAVASVASSDTSSALGLDGFEIQGGRTSTSLLDHLEEMTVAEILEQPSTTVDESPSVAPPFPDLDHAATPATASVEEHDLSDVYPSRRVVLQERSRPAIEESEPLPQFAGTISAPAETPQPSDAADDRLAFGSMTSSLLADTESTAAPMAEPPRVVLQARTSPADRDDEPLRLRPRVLAQSRSYVSPIPVTASAPPAATTPVIPALESSTRDIPAPEQKPADELSDVPAPASSPSLIVTTSATPVEDPAPTFVTTIETAVAEPTPAPVTATPPKAPEIVPTEWSSTDPAQNAKRAPRWVDPSWLPVGQSPAATTAPAAPSTLNSPGTSSSEAPRVLEDSATSPASPRTTDAAAVIAPVIPAPPAETLDEGVSSGPSVWVRNRTSSVTVTSPKKTAAASSPFAGWSGQTLVTAILSLALGLFGVGTLLLQRSTADDAE